MYYYTSRFCSEVMGAGINLKTEWICTVKFGMKTKSEARKRRPHSDWQQCLAHGPLPLRYDFVGVREVAVNVFHLERVSVTNLVVCAAVVGGFDHDDVTPRAPEINGVALA